MRRLICIHDISFGLHKYMASKMGLQKYAMSDPDLHKYAAPDVDHHKYVTSVLDLPSMNGSEVKVDNILTLNSYH